MTESLTYDLGAVEDCDCHDGAIWSDAEQAWERCPACSGTGHFDVSDQEYEAWLNDEAE